MFFIRPAAQRPKGAQLAPQIPVFIQRPFNRPGALFPPQAASRTGGKPESRLKRSAAKNKQDRHIQYLSCLVRETGLEPA
jgi:hypothetical protein